MVVDIQQHPVAVFGFKLVTEQLFVAHIDGNHALRLEVRRFKSLGKEHKLTRHRVENEADIFAERLEHSVKSAQTAHRVAVGHTVSEQKNVVAAVEYFPRLVMCNVHFSSLFSAS